MSSKPARKTTTKAGGSKGELVSSPSSSSEGESLSSGRAKTKRTRGESKNKGKSGEKKEEEEGAEKPRKKSRKSKRERLREYTARSEEEAREEVSSMAFPSREQPSAKNKSMQEEELELEMDAIKTPGRRAGGSKHASSSLPSPESIQRQREYLLFLASPGADPTSPFGEKSTRKGGKGRTKRSSSLSPIATRSNGGEPSTPNPSEQLEDLSFDLSPEAAEKLREKKKKSMAKYSEIMKKRKAMLSKRK